MSKERDERTIVTLLRRAAASEHGVRFLDASEGDGVRFGYRALLARAENVAAALAAHGLVSGDRVALVLPTAPSFYDAFFGALLAGLVPVPLYPPLRLGRMEEYHARTAAMLRACGARLVLSDRRIRRLLGGALERAAPELGCEAVEALPSSLCGDGLVVPGPDATAFLQFSSGTTVAPKPVTLTHRQVLANVSAIQGAILGAWPEQDGLEHVGVSWLPLYHDMGLVGAVLVALAHPSELVLLPPEHFVARPARWLRAVSRFRGTTSPAPNFAYALCAECIRDEELAGVDLSSWRIALDGAEPVSPGVLERFVERFRRFGLREEALTPVYGLAEAALAVTFGDLRRRFRTQRFAREALLQEGVARSDAAGQPLVSVGRPLPGFEVRIRAEDGRALAESRLGRVWVRGPSLMRGYYGLPEQTASALQDGWLDTGDTGFLHQGELFLYGRAKDVIVLRGRNHAPQDVEHAIDDLDGVRAGCSAAVGLLEEGGEELAIFVERARGYSGTDAELAARVARRITERHAIVPARVVVLAPGTLPRTSSGKIRRAETRRRFLADELLPPKPVTRLRVLGELLRSRMALARASRAH